MVAIADEDDAVRGIMACLDDLVLDGVCVFDLMANGNYEDT